MHEETTSTSLDRYVDEIRDELYGPWWVRRRIAAEFQDHLRDSAEHLQADGKGREEAERVAIERFGAPSVVARSLAHARGVGVPTGFTRQGGAALAIGAVTLSASRIGQEFSESFSNGLFGEVSFIPRVLCGIGLLALYLRVRGNIGVWGRRGFQLVVNGFVVGFGSSLAWIEPGGWVGVAMIGVGVAVYLAAVAHTGEVSRRAVAAIAVSVATTFLVGLGGTAGGVDTGTVANVVGSVSLAVTLGWLGVSLWSEREGVEVSPRVHRGVLVEPS